MERILVLEDDDNLRELIGDTLEDAGYQVELCSQADQAIEAARRQVFHLLLTDVRMAGELDGVAALEQIKKFRPQLRSIVMTGYASLEVPLRAARVQADDYLLKGDAWFGVQELLAAIRRVLERPVQGSGWLARLAQLPAGLLVQAVRGTQEERLFDLARERERVINHFYLLLRPGHLSLDSSYPLFGRLLRLESQYRLACAEPGKARLMPAGRLDRLVADYAGLAADLDQSDADGREDPLLPLRRFQILYDKIRRGRVDQAQFQQAPRLWSEEEFRLGSAEAYALYHWLWSEKHEEGDGFVSLELGPYTLAQRLPGALEKVRFYQARHRERPQEQFWVICLPVDADNRALVESDKRATRALYWQEIYGCYFTVFDKHSLSLKYQIPADGLSARQTFELLDPVFHQVGRYHREGRYSGGFALTDIHKLPGKAAYLHRFDQQAYQHAQQWQSGERLALGMHFCFAPEAPDSSGPPAASADQAVLGRLFLEVVLGQNLDPIPAFMLHQFELPSIASLWERLVPELGAAWNPVRRLCHPDPEQRFPSWAEAYLQLRQALAASV